MAKLKYHVIPVCASNRLLSIVSWRSRVSSRVSSSRISACRSVIRMYSFSFPLLQNIYYTKYIYEALYKNV